MPASNAKETALCAICQAEFVKPHARARYCSKPCLWKSKNQRRTPEKAREYNVRQYWKDVERSRAQGRANHAKFRASRNATASEKFQKSRLETPWRTLLASRQTHATRKGLPFDLTEDWAKSRWTGLCELTGIPFLLGQRGTGPKPYSPSIDKIDPARGYTADNCRFVIHAVNALKGTLSDQEMYEIAEALIKAR